MEHAAHSHKPKRQHVIIFAVILGAIAAGVFGYIAYQNIYPPLQTIDFGGQILSFRADLREAQGVQVVPDANTVYDHITKLPRAVKDGRIVYRQPLMNVTIAFKPVSPEKQGWYSLEAAEIIAKLTALYKGQFGVDLTFNTIIVDDYATLRGTSTDPIIALVHPDITNGERSVKVDPDKEVITISGGKSLHDFDLATVRFMSVALGLEL